MNTVIAEETLLELYRREPDRLEVILNEYDVVVEIRRFDLDSSKHTCYLTIEMTKEEILHMVRKLDNKEKHEKILDIRDDIWYKYFEEKHSLSTSITLKEPNMNQEQIVQTGKTFWDNHGGKIKTMGLLLLGMVVGAGVKTAMDRRAESSETNQTTA